MQDLAPSKAQRDLVFTNERQLGAIIETRAHCNGNLHLNLTIQLNPETVFTPGEVIESVPLLEKLPMILLPEFLILNDLT